MKLVSILVFLSLSISSEWLTDINKAKAEAAQKNRYILVNFSGSDWCIPCMRLKKEVFDDRLFQEFADSNLVLVNIDFPHNKKHRLSKEQAAQNEKLAEQYNPNGKLPLTLLLTAEGKVMQSWDEMNTIPPAIFINQIKMIIHGNS